MRSYQEDLCQLATGENDCLIHDVDIRDLQENYG